MNNKALDNYLHQSLKEAYNVLTSNDDPWPNNFQNKKKTKFIDQLITYFQEREEYEQCAELLKVKNMIINKLDDKEK